MAPQAQAGEESASRTEGEAVSVKLSRLIDLQRQLSISRTALTAISHGCRNHEGVASAALDALWLLDKKQPLQGVVDHGQSIGRQAEKAKP